MLVIAFFWLQGCHSGPKGLVVVEATLVKEISDWNDTIFFGLIVDIEFANNQYFVSDGQAHHVIVLDDQLAYISRFGNSGDGPAEIRSIRNVETSGEDIYVHDMLGAKMLKYNSDFQLTDTFKIHLAPSEIMVDNYTIYGQV